MCSASAVDSQTSSWKLTPRSAQPGPDYERWKALYEAAPEGEKRLCCCGFRQYQPKNPTWQQPYDVGADGHRNPRLWWRRLTGVPRNAHLATHECFGPLAPIFSVRDLDDGITRNMRFITAEHGGNLLGEKLECDVGPGMLRRKAFLKLPIEERRRIFEAQAEKLQKHYEESEDWNVTEGDAFHEHK